MSKSYYSKLYPQSSYRKYTAETDVPERQPISLDLQDLKLKNENDKDFFRKKILEEAKNVIGVLLPEDKRESALNSSCIKSIYENLGL